MGKSRRSKRGLAYNINTGSLAGPLSARSFLSILSIGGAGSSPSTDHEEPEPEEGRSEQT